MNAFLWSIFETCIRTWSIYIVGIDMASMRLDSVPEKGEWGNHMNSRQGWCRTRPVGGNCGTVTVVLPEKSKFKHIFCMERILISLSLCFMMSLYFSTSVSTEFFWRGGSGAVMFSLSSRELAASRKSEKHMLTLRGSVSGPRSFCGGSAPLLRRKFFTQARHSSISSALSSEQS